MSVFLYPRSVPLAVLPRALAAGWRDFLRAWQIGLALGGGVALIGGLLLWGAGRLALAPFGVALVGGFLLLGPVLMAGFVGLSEALAAGRPPAWREVLAGWRAAPAGLGAVALFCGLVFFIWLGDAGTLYSFMVGESAGDAAAQGVMRFHLSSGVTGLVLALIVYGVTVHAVPLLATGRATLVGAVVGSVRAVFRSPLVHAGWGLILAAGIFACLLAPPVLILSLPVLAHGGQALHREVFPPA